MTSQREVSSRDNLAFSESDVVVPSGRAPFRAFMNLERCLDWRKSIIRIKVTSVYVDNQAKALKFYTEVLGFVKKTDLPAGKFRWLTVVSPEETDGTELLLEPSDNPATKGFKKALFEQGIPLTSFAVDDVQKEYKRMKKLGVLFTMAPTMMGPATVAVFDDTCGNLIQLAQR